MNCRRFPTPPNPSTPTPTDPSPEEIAGELRCLSGPWVEPCPDGSGRLLLARDGRLALQLAAELAFGGRIAEVNEALRSRGIDHLVSASLRYTTG